MDRRLNTSGLESLPNALSLFFYLGLSTIALILRRAASALIGIYVVSLIAVSASGASVLSHEALVDALWDVTLQPLLKARYPNASLEELKTAHAYAYGGAIIQDLGYYPHGNKQFSDLTHYVRTGSFVLSLIAEARDLNELAFALGALSHYSSDTQVHRFATNPGEAVLYPKLQRKFGSVITYEEDPAAHLKTEFGFDVLEVAKGNFAPEAYHNFIGFAVTGPLLERAFRDTYGLELADMFSDFNKTIGSYRWAVCNLIPKATRIAWAERENEIEHAHPGVSQDKFLYLMSRSSYERDWGKQYERPKAADRLLAVLAKMLPPVGPLLALRFKMPTPDVEKLFLRSFDNAAKEYGQELDAERATKLKLNDVNYDLGEAAAPGTYALQDESYAYWLNQLARRRFQSVTPEIMNELLTYYGDPDAPFATRRKSKEWNRLLLQLQGLREQQSVRASR